MLRRFFARFLGPDANAKLEVLATRAEQAQATGDLDTAAGCYEAALRIAPESAPCHSNLGTLRKSQGKLQEAERHYRRAVQIAPDLAQAWYNLGVLLHDTWRLDEAEEALWRALSLVGKSEDNAFLDALLRTQAVTLQSLGRHAKAREFLREAAGHFPDHGATCAAIALFSLSADPQVEASELLRGHREWAERYADPITAAAVPHAIDANPRRLRLGYVSGDFRDHAVGRFIEPVLANHDRDRFEIFCYDNSPFEDGITANLRSHADVWRNIVSLSDDAAAAMVRSDGIDILVDLSGHTNHNRLALFARRPAPLQLNYLGFNSTTGMRAMDWHVTDAVTDPQGIAEHVYTERLLRLPNCQWCYVPPPCPLPGTFPTTPGVITFGSFNQFGKITRRMLQLWARILAQIPHSRLQIRGVPRAGLDDVALDCFAQQGVAADRLVLLTGRPAAEQYWLAYRGADIALDTHPYNGVTTTCESLWMGLPVVTLAGQYGGARCAASILDATGMPELIANSDDEYLRIAVELACDPTRLARLHRQMRERLLRSPLMNARRLSADLEAGFLMAWNETIAANPPAAAI
ncbi:MAG: tetratricopeptide repeat protein [Burkholderiales bacterium]